MKNYFPTKILIVILLLSASLSVFSADTNYTLLEPGVFGGELKEVKDFNDYASRAFTVLLGVSIALAILRIVLGGFEYITSSTGAGKSGGKEKINNALIGLAIILLSWLALYTINPGLVNWEFKVEPLDTKVPPA